MFGLLSHKTVTFIQRKTANLKALFTEQAIVI